MSKFKQFLLLLIVALTGATIVPAISYAHELQSSGPIHIIMHIEPDDNPISGKQSTLVFYVFDDQENFSGTHCDCNVSITMDGTNLLSKLINIGDKGFNHVGELPFSFPMLGYYQIHFSGKPIDGSNFQAFNLNYGQDVSKAAYIDPTSAPDRPFFIGSAVLLLAIMGFALWVVREFKDA